MGLPMLSTWSMSCRHPSQSRSRSSMEVEDSSKSFVRFRVGNP